MTLRVCLGLASIFYAQSQLDMTSGDPKKILAAHRRQEEASQLYQEVYQARRHSLGTDHPHTHAAKASVDFMQRVIINPFAPRSGM